MLGLPEEMEYAMGPSSHEHPRTTDLIVIGGGVIGLACAWRAASKGMSVTLVDPMPGRGASWAAAGMLAPVSEAHYGEESLIRLNLASARAWPGFAAELECASGIEIGYRTCGTLSVAIDRGDMAVLEELYRFQDSLGLNSALLGPSECRHLEPLMTPGIRGGLLASEDHQVANRALIEALLSANQRSGVRLIAARAQDLSLSDGRCVGVRLTDSTVLATGTVLLAAGCWSAQLGGLPFGMPPPVRPVKGVILRLRGPASSPILARNLRGMVGGSSVYLVPRTDGTLVVGATVEEQGFDTTVTVGSVADLLGDARAVIPAVDELQLVETHAGLRPGSPDNAPILGRSAVEGLVIATGHYRNGVLLTPVTADAIAEVLTRGSVPDLIAPFSPGRWERTAAKATR